ncbi:MAG: hypothetical protein KAS23_04780 [Anaerohalosphaera sp.]|nr:hypothetical protein [Anaerohalosphaera sp.]
MWTVQYDGSSDHTIGLWHFNEHEVYSEGTSYLCVNDVVNAGPRRARIRTGSDASYATGGKFGWGVHNIGGSDVNDRVDVYDGVNVFPAGTDPSLTVECWVKFNDVAGLQFIIDKQWGYSDVSGGYRLYLNSGNIQWRLGDGSKTMYVAGKPGAGIVTGRWYHIAGTWDAATDTSKLYIDGIPVASKVFTGSSIVDNSYSVRFAQRCVSNYAALNGSLDEVRISDVAYDMSDKTINSADLYPLGDTFCFTFYSTREADSVYSLQNGATAIGPYYGDQSGALQRAVDLDTKFIYKVHPACMMGNSFLDDDFVMPDDETIINDTIAAVNAVKDNLNIDMWDVVPEELRHWKSLEMHYLGLVTSTIRATDSYNRPIYMYEPNNRNAAALSKTLVYQDICAKGMYVEAVGMRENRIWCRWSMEQELEAIANVKPSAIPWIVLWMAWDAEAGQEHLIDDWCRHDAYIGLLMGGKGIEIWSGWRGRAGFSDDFDAYLDGYLSVANDLNGELGLGKVFLYGQKLDDVTVDVISGPETLTVEYDGTHEYPSITHLCVEHDGQQYLFMINSAQEAVSVIFRSVSVSVREDVFGGGTQSTPLGEFSIVLSPLEVKCFKFAAEISGDLNGNGVIEAGDIAVLAAKWLSGDQKSDISPVAGDGIVNYLDFSAVANVWITE